jgi:hypothetical protein
MEFAKSTQPIISVLDDTEYTLRTTIENVDVSVVNAIRRTILSEIPTVVFCTSPPEKDQCVIHRNTSILNNEIIKHRLGCLPIHHVHTLPPDVITGLLMELHVVNTTDDYLMVTSKDFKVKHKDTGKYLDDADLRKIFPPSRVVMDAFGVESYTDIVKLRPKLNELPGDIIKLQCDFSYSNANEDSSYNVVSACSYSNLQDSALVTEAYNAVRQKYVSDGLDPVEIEFRLTDWLLLDAYRYVNPYGFEFVVETLGVYSNKEIVVNAINIIIDNIQSISNTVDIVHGITDKEYKIMMYKEEYTIGKLFENAMFATYFENSQILTYCGFKKLHPHDTYALLRLEYAETLGDAFQTVILNHLNESIVPVVETFTHIRDRFV